MSDIMPHMPPLSKVRQPLFVEVRQQLVADLGARYQPGDRLAAEPELATAYGVSRPTMREVLRTLESDGLVQRVHGVGTFVTRTETAVTSRFDLDLGVTEAVVAANRKLDIQILRIAGDQNVYAIAVGVCHGLTEAGGEPWHDLAAATFTQAVTEMRRLAVAVGGREETALGLAGVGDLEVTSLSGRNRVFGARVGRGEPPAAALAAMAAAGQTVEGVPAARLARDLATQLARERPDEAGDLPARLPLLAAVNRLL